jgi:hypothetical protein
VNFRENNWTKRDADIVESVRYGATQGLSDRKIKFAKIFFPFYFHQPAKNHVTIIRWFYWVAWLIFSVRPTTIHFDGITRTKVDVDILIGNQYTNDIDIFLPSLVTTRLAPRS